MRWCAWHSKSGIGTSPLRSTGIDCSCPTTSPWSSSSIGSACRGNGIAPSSRPSERDIAMTIDDASDGAGIPLLALLQISDGLFPAGAFAHSLGLETYTQSGIVKDRDGLDAFVRAHLEGSAGPADAVAVAGALRCAAAGDLDGCLSIDARVDAMRFVPEFTAASKQMGRQ